MSKQTIDTREQEIKRSLSKRSIQIFQEKDAEIASLRVELATAQQELKHYKEEREPRWESFETAVEKALQPEFEEVRQDHAESGNCSLNNITRCAIDMIREQAKSAEALVVSLKAEKADLDLTWAAASEFIRDVIEALGMSQPVSEAKVDLPAIALQVVGQIEDYKVRAEAAESQVAELRAKLATTGKEIQELVVALRTELAATKELAMQALAKEYDRG